MASQSGVVEGQDYGAPIALLSVYSREGELLRAPLVQVDQDAADPDDPKRRIRRARRVDHLHTLLAAKTVSQRMYDAAELLRSQLEAVTGLSGGVGFGSPVVDTSTVPDVSVPKLHAARQVRAAFGAIPADCLPTVQWIVLGRFSVDSCAKRLRRRRSTIPALLCEGLEALADHYWGKPVSKA